MLKKAICILGMHRSGTSCLSGSLQKAGLYLGDVSSQSDFNLKGNRENRKIQLLLDKVLAENYGSWHNPPESVVWSDERYSELLDIVSEYKKYPAWGFKDPRALFALSGFQQCIDNLQFVGTFRNPKSVVASLARRHAIIDKVTPISEEYWLELWNRYNLRLIEEWQTHQFPIIDFDQEDSDYLNSLEVLLGQIGLTQSLAKGLQSRFKQDGFLASLKQLIYGKKHSVFFDSKLRSSIIRSTENLPPHIVSTYKKLKEISV